MATSEIDDLVGRWFVKQKMLNGAYCLVGGPCDSELAAIACKESLGNGDELEVFEMPAFNNPSQRRDVAQW